MSRRAVWREKKVVAFLTQEGRDTVVEMAEHELGYPRPGRYIATVPGGGCYRALGWVAYELECNPSELSVDAGDISSWGAK